MAPIMELPEEAKPHYLQCVSKRRHCFAHNIKGSVTSSLAAIFC